MGAPPSMQISVFFALRRECRPAPEGWADDRRDAGSDEVHELPCSDDGAEHLLPVVDGVPEGIERRKVGRGLEPVEGDEPAECCGDSQPPIHAGLAERVVPGDAALVHILGGDAPASFVAAGGESSGSVRTAASGENQEACRGSDRVGKAGASRGREEAAGTEAAGVARAAAVAEGTAAAAARAASRSSSRRSRIRATRQTNTDVGTEGIPAAEVAMADTVEVTAPAVEAATAAEAARVGTAANGAAKMEEAAEAAAATELVEAEGAARAVRVMAETATASRAGAVVREATAVGAA
eukprot:7380069-Prymnesium_polylepis.1